MLIEPCQIRRAATTSPRRPCSRPFGEVVKSDFANRYSISGKGEATTSPSHQTIWRSGRFGEAVSRSSCIVNYGGSAGKYQVVVTASNGTDSDSAAFFWQVGQVVIANPGSQINMTGDAVSLTLTAHESGSPTLTYSATGLPAGLAISSGGVISGTITAPGSTIAVVTVSDGTNSASTAFAWTVSGPLFLADPGNQTSSDGDVVYLPLAATDPVGETLSYSASSLPTGLSISSSHRRHFRHRRQHKRPRHELRGDRHGDRQRQPHRQPKLHLDHRQALAEESRRLRATTKAMSSRCN